MDGMEYDGFLIGRWHLPPDGEKFIGLFPTWVWRRCNIDDGFDASLADDDRFLVIGPNSSRLRTVDIALQQRKLYDQKINVIECRFGRNK